VEVTLSHPSGAGGYSISPQFRSKQRVKWGPAFDVIAEFFRSFRDGVYCPLENEGFLDRTTTLTERKLLKLFQDGEASPGDIDIDDGTLLQVNILIPNYLWRS
jgi:hypothetical protein